MWISGLTLALRQRTSDPKSFDHFLIDIFPSPTRQSRTGTSNTVLACSCMMSLDLSSMWGNNTKRGTDFAENFRFSILAIADKHTGRKK